jgi:hypothetical protein
MVRSLVGLLLVHRRQAGWGCRQARIRPQAGQTADPHSHSVIDVRISSPVLFLRCHHATGFVRILICTWILSHRQRCTSEGLITGQMHVAENPRSGAQLVREIPALEKFPSLSMRSSICSPTSGPIKHQSDKTQPMSRKSVHTNPRSFSDR